MARARDGEGKIPGSFLDNSYQEPDPQVREANRVTLAAIHMHAVAEAERARKVIEFVHWRADPTTQPRTGLSFTMGNARRMRTASFMMVAALMAGGMPPLEDL